MTKSQRIALSVILEEGKFVQATVAASAIIAVQEDPDNDKRSYILLSSGHDMHIDLSHDEVLKAIS